MVEIKFNQSYLLSVVGICRIAEIVVGIVALGLTATDDFHFNRKNPTCEVDYMTEANDMMLAFSVLSFVFSFILFVLALLNISEAFPEQGWKIGQMSIDGLCAVGYLASAIFIIAVATCIEEWTAAAAFGLIGVILHLVTIFFVKSSSS